MGCLAPRSPAGWPSWRLIGQQSIGNRPLLLFGILLIFTGVQLVTLGLLAELQARTSPNRRTSRRTRSGRYWRRRNFQDVRWEDQRI